METRKGKSQTLLKTVVTGTTISKLTCHCLPNVKGNGLSNRIQTHKLESVLRRQRNPTDSSDTAKYDAALDLELSMSRSVRRSTRLRRNPELSYSRKRTVEPTKPTKPAKKALQTLLNIEQSLLSFDKPNISPFEVIISPSDGLPTVLSTEWQLKYPPGGSTHPSYPWPSADLRLTFQPHCVPIVNGLPDISHLPSLILPTGWRHVSWSGLNPVVFDHYHQAFKLTQVGPLPLTSEELHQGGLHNYVPGGKFHPEAGLLPSLSVLSDGSDTDVFTFDGVDWKLPWAQIEGIPLDNGCLADITENDLMILDQSANSNLPKPILYAEARDYPDDVFDLEDGWRWLSNKEILPSMTFSPAPGRKWRGLGVQRTSRKVKQPIAALMAIAIAEKEGENPEHYLGNQRLREFCVFKSIATPVHINITLLQDVEFTLVGLLWFFPNHYQWRKAGDRLKCSEFSASNVANFINMSRELSGTSICNNSTVHGHLLRNQDEKEAEPEETRTNHQTISYTAEEWTYSAWETTDYPLLALAHGLLELPSGPDAGPLTAMIQWFRDNNRFRAMLSDVPALLKEADIEPLIESGEGFEPDQEVLSRHIEAIKKDRQRVLQEKKDSESRKDGKPMKRKVV
ncbi:hypothetical protein N0V94_002815 [Neodidymelliopsis sp. IMI 364377]|nr:hypothetical protein N0V94_002815 [Neodidymelliopsis sp. IMI 364377]